MPTFVLFNIYLFYGLVFFAIGCVIIFRNFKYSQLKVASTLWALAGFGFFHAFHEWSELYVILFSEQIDPSHRVWVAWLRLIKLFLSYLALMVFAWQILSITNRALARGGHLVISAILVVYFGMVIGRWYDIPMDGVMFSNISILTRAMIGFGSALLAGIGFIVYGKMLKKMSQPCGQYFVGSGIGLLLYGVFSGIVPTDLHYSVPVLRTLAATITLVALYQALRVFDIERERATEAKLKRAVEADKFNAIGQLSMGVAHEINNPLASATLALDLLSRTEEEISDQQRDYIRRVRLGIDRAAVISKELLNYARPVEEKGVKIDLREVLESAISLLSHRCKAYQISISCESALFLYGQKVKLEELFINLISNAIDASTPGEEVGIILTQDEEFTKIKILDRGCGMDKQTVKRALEPFFSTKAIGEGTGLGLAICDKIVTAHNGRMQIRSEPNLGTQVFIELKRENKV